LSNFLEAKSKKFWNYTYGLETFLRHI